MCWIHIWYEYRYAQTHALVQVLIFNNVFLFTTDGNMKCKSSEAVVESTSLQYNFWSNFSDFLSKSLVCYFIVILH